MIDPALAVLPAQFSCIFVPISNGNAHLVCARGGALTEVTDYKQNYAKSYAANVSLYMNAAGQCASSSGDSAFAAPTQLSSPLLMLSQMELGFVTMLAERDGTLLHSIVSTDPAIVSWDEEALEVVEAFSNSEANNFKKIDKQRADRWRSVEVDSGDEFKTRFRSLIASVPIPLYVDFAALTLRSGYKRAREIEAGSVKADGFARLTNAVKDRLNEANFVHIAGETFRSMFGMSEDDLFAQIAFTQPYGLRRQLTSIPTIRFYMRESDICLPDEGGILALVAEQPAADAQPGEYGHVAVTIVAGGNCLEDDREEARTLVRALLNEVKPEVED